MLILTRKSNESIYIYKNGSQRDILKMIDVTIIACKYEVCRMCICAPNYMDIVKYEKLVDQNFNNKITKMSDLKFGQQMVLLTRKLGQSVNIYVDGMEKDPTRFVNVEILKSGKRIVRLGICAPKDLAVHRSEIHDKIIHNNEIRQSLNLDMLPSCS